MLFAMCSAQPQCQTQSICLIVFVSVVERQYFSTVLLVLELTRCERPYRVQWLRSTLGAVSEPHVRCVQCQLSKHEWPRIKGFLEVIAR